jgi:hypothetical protein
MRVFFDTSALTKRYVEDLSDTDLCDLSQDAFEQTIRCLEIILCGRSPLFMPFRLRRSPASQGSRPEGLAVVDLSL